MEREGNALRYASDELRNDKDIVSLAVSNRGYALKWASEAMRADEDVVIAATTTDPSAIRFASQEIQNEVGNNHAAKYLKAKRLYEEIAPSIEREHGHIDDEPEQAPKLKI